MHIQLNEDLLARTDLTSAEKLVIGYINYRKNLNGWRLSVSDIANKLGLTRQGVHKILKDLNVNQVDMGVNQVDTDVNLVDKKRKPGLHYNKEQLIKKKDIQISKNIPSFHKKPTDAEWKAMAKSQRNQSWT